MFLLYHAYVYLEFLILACTIYILAPDYEEDENLDDDCEMEKRKLYDEDDDIIFFFSPEYGYAEDEEDCDVDNNL